MWLLVASDSIVDAIKPKRPLLAQSGLGTAGRGVAVNILDRAGGISGCLHPLFGMNNAAGATDRQPSLEDFCSSSSTKPPLASVPLRYSLVM